MSLTPELVAQALAEISKGVANYNYFFQRLSSPEWIQPLRENGYFGQPPEPIEDDDGIRIPSWLPSQYLARVAAHAPSQVTDVIVSISTDNELIHEDFAEAATAVPGPCARRIAKREAKWLHRKRHLYVGMPLKHALLIRHLAEEGEVDAAFSLARELFRARRRDVSGLGKELEAKFSEWFYSEAIDEAAPALLAAAPEPSMVFLIQLLSQIATQEQTFGSGWTADYFRVWRPRLEDDERRRESVEQSILSVTRDAAVAIREQTLLSTDRLLDLLLAKDSRTFHRLACHALAAPPPADPGELRRVLLTHAAFFEGEPSPEYRELLRSSFRGLHNADRRKILDWIDIGPPQDSSLLAQPVEGGERDERAAIWGIQRLEVIRDDLPPRWRTRYAALVQKHGEHSFGTSFEVHVSGGPTSPMNLDAMRKLSDKDLLEMLATYRGEHRWMGPSVDGLARVFTALAEEDPMRVSRLAPALAQLRPTFVSGALNGIEQSLRKGLVVDWPQLADLIEAVIDRADDQPADFARDENLGRWQWVRKSIADVLVLAFQGGECEAPWDLRSRLWAVLEVLTSDPEPDRAYEEKYGGTNMDPATLALNTIRGRALQSVVNYAVWVKRNIAHATEPVASPISEMPEAQRVLELHLDVSRDDSYAVRSVYGQYLAWIIDVDEKWAAGLVPRIFPRGRDLESLRSSAWEAYLVWCPTSDACFRVLCDEYAWASREAESPPQWTWQGSMESPRVHLAQHLLAYYARGLIEIADSDGLLRSFFAEASSEVRSRALAVVGGVISNATDIPSATAARLMALWEWRVRETQATKIPTDLRELQSLGWWLQCECFPIEWRFDRLDELLQIDCPPDPIWFVFSFLRRAAPIWPLRVTKALEDLGRLAAYGWELMDSNEDVKETLRACLSSDDSGAQAKALDLVHLLGAKGHASFRDLVD
jgi:hypothetical protein